jgi:hypothetical protein
MIILKLIVGFLTSVIAIVAALDKKRNIKRLVIFCVLFLFVVTGIMEFITLQEKKKKDREFEALAKTIQNIDEKLDPFIKIAEKRYPDLTKEKALKKLQTDIENIDARAKILEKKAANYSTYAEVATWNFNGSKIVGSGVEVSSPVAGWMKNYIQGKDGGLKWKCDSSAIAHFRSIIKAQPNYPFPYYFLAICLKEKGDQTWQKYAKDGIQILEKTTTIPGHDPGHDDALKRMKDLFKN